MSLDFHQVVSAESAGHAVAGTHGDWRERLVTIVATSLAVLIVAAIAVLMGMA